MAHIPPLADRMRPKTVDDIIGQDHIFAKNKLLRRMIEADRLTSIILYGPPGTGKTSIANVIAHTTNACFRPINATTAGKADMKAIIEGASALREAEDKNTILFIDEIHRFNKAQQDYLLPFVEQGMITLIGATTENPYFEVNGALLSRSSVFELKSLSKADVIIAIDRALKDPVDGFGKTNIDMPADAKDYIASVTDGDVRHALNALELAAITTPPDNSGIIHITTDVIMECAQIRVMRFDKRGDNHYDFISAFIESMRHSDVDATLYYLARMLSAGEDPKYIARRLIVFAGEDNSLADPTAHILAVSAFLAVERVGMPEAMYSLALSAVYCAAAPKTHSVQAGIHAAMNAVKNTGNISIPAFLQDESYKSARKLNRGGVTDVYQTPFYYDGLDCLPRPLRGSKFFDISKPFGHEREVKKFMDWCEGYLKEHPAPKLEND